MRPGGGSEKGGSYERRVCKALSFWISKGRRDDIFWRTPMSGGRHTVRRRKGTGAMDEVGDIRATHESGKPFINQFVLDCKSYRNLKMHTLLVPKAAKKSIAAFWSTTVRIAEEVHRQPIMVCKENKLPDFVLLYEVTALGLGLEDWIVARYAPLKVCLVWLSDFVMHAKQVT